MSGAHGPAGDWRAIVAGGGKLVVGNWKMHGTRAMLPIVTRIAAAARRHPAVGVGLALPHTLIALAHAIAPDLIVGAQDHHAKPDGAHTGQISAAMVRDAGARFTILNHSELRHGPGAQVSIVRAKIARAAEHALTVVLCCGETDEERRAGRAEHAVCARLAELLTPSCPGADIVIAYEPYWAIGSGRRATGRQIADMHAAIREMTGALSDHQFMPILYGGSVGPEDAGSIAALPCTDGVLLGSASLDSAAFARVLSAV